MADTISEDALNPIFEGGPNPIVDIVFVHGLNGYPRKTWEAHDPEDINDRIFWPLDFLPKKIENARIFTYGYRTAFSEFYPVQTTPISHTNIDHHSAGLIAKLGNLRRDTNTLSRPIIFVCHSLGGLVVSNALSSKYKAEDQGQKVIDHTCGTIFLGTPFKGSSKAPWAEMARRVLDWAGDTNASTIQDLNKRSEKLQQISIDFQKLVQSRATSSSHKPIQVACFFEEMKTRKSLLNVKKDLGLIVTAASATLAGYPEVGINADHAGMCRFYSEDQAGYLLVSGKIEEMIANLKKTNTELTKEGKTVVNISGIEMGSNHTNIGGFIAAAVVGTTENAVNNTINNTFGMGTAQMMADLQKKSHAQTSIA